MKPDVVITWGPTGISSHDDHIAVHRATVEAFNRYRLTAAQEPLLYFAAITDEVAKMLESEGLEFEIHESERMPTVVIDIREHKSLKIRVLRMRPTCSRSGRSATRPSTGPIRLPRQVGSGRLLGLG